MASERPRLSDKDITQTIARERQAQLAGSADQAPSDEAARAMEEGIRQMPNAIARERAAQLVGSGEDGRTEHTDAAQRVIDDIRKAMVDGDMRAFQRAHEGLGTVPGINDVYDFRARGGLPLISSSRQLGLTGGLDEVLGSDKRLGRRWQDFLDDLGKAAGGDRRALGRAARNLGIGGSDLQQLYRQTASNPGLVRAWADALGVGRPGSSGGGDGTGGGGSGAPADVAGDKVTPAERDPFGPFDRTPDDGSPVAPSGGGGDADAPPATDDPDPGAAEEGDQDSSNPPGEGAGEQRPRGEVTLGEGTDHGEEGARVHTHSDGGYTIYYPDGRVETYDANGEMTDSWKWDPDAVNNAGEGRPTDDAPIDSPLMPKVTWELMTRPAGPPVIGAAPVTPIDPQLGEDPASGEVGTGDGVYDPPEESDGWTSGPPRAPQGGGPVDPVDPGMGEEAPGTGPLNDEGGGRTSGRGRFVGAARAAGRAAVGVGLFAAGFVLGGTFNDRGAGDAVPAATQPPVEGSRDGGGAGPEARETGPRAARDAQPKTPAGYEPRGPERAARRPSGGLSGTSDRAREPDVRAPEAGGRDPVTERDGGTPDNGSGFEEGPGVDEEEEPGGGEAPLGSLNGGSGGSPED